jgi:hypothetical protein
MKPLQIYEALQLLAEQLEVAVTEQNFRNIGINVTSGLCRVKGEKLFLMDKHKSIREKISILVDHLSQMPHEQIYVVPAVRELLLEKEGRQANVVSRDKTLKKFT